MNIYVTNRTTSEKQIQMFLGGHRRGNERNDNDVVQWMRNSITETTSEEEIHFSANVQRAAKAAV